MPDVGVLQLSIHDNSEQAEQGLIKLADALVRVREAVNGIKLTGIATQISKIAKVIDDEVHGSTIAKLSEFGDALSKLKGLGNIKINMRNSSNTTRAMDTVENAMESIETGVQDGLDAGFSTASASIQQANADLQDVGATMQEVNNIVHNTNWAEQFDPSKLPLDALGSKMSDSARETRQWGEAVKDSFETIRNSGMMDHVYPVQEASEASNSIILYNENIANSWENICERMAAEGHPIVFHSMEEAAQHFGISVEEVRDKLDETFNRVYSNPGMTVFSSLVEAAQATGTTIEGVLEQLQETYDMVYGTGTGTEPSGGGSGMFNYVEEEAETSRTLLDMLRDKIAILQEEINTGMNARGKFLDEKTIVNDEIQVERLTHLVEELQNRIQSGVNVGQAGFVGNIGDYSRYDLMTMKLDGMKQALEEDIRMNKLDSQQIAERAMRIQQLTEKIEALKTAQGETTKFTEKMHNAWEGLKSGITGMFPTFTQLIKQFMRIAKYRMIRAVIKHITQGFSEGVQNVYQYSKAIGSSFSESMDSAASSLLQMKNSVGAAVAPLIQQLIPVMQTVVNWFITAVNYLNQFIALLNGQTSWTRALPATTTAFGKQEKAAKGAANAIKDLLADWDELNIIQSNTTGGAGGGAAQAAEDYLSMFEQVDKFDDKVKSIVEFLQDHMKEVKRLITEAGLALLAWKFSNAFTGILSQLATVATIGLLIGVAFEASTLLDEAYVESDNIGYLIGDTVLTAALAGIGAKLASAQFGETAGWITAGLTFAVSAGATFAVAKDVADESKRKMLDLFGAVKFGIGAALFSAGFWKLGMSLVPSIAFGIFTAALVAYITYSVKIAAEEAQKAADMAKAAFAQTGEGGGIKAQDYVDALQAEFTKQTGSARLILDAYVDVPDLKSKLTSAALQIAGFNWIIFNGAGELTEEDANSFKENWNTVLETLDKMNKDSYGTILAGLTDALASKSEEIRKRAEEIRVSFIMMEKEITAENAELYKQLEDLTSKIASGTFTQDDLKEYEKLYNIYAAATETGMANINAAIANGERIDFGDEATALDNAKEFISTVGNSAADAIKEVDDSVAAVEKAIALKQSVEYEKMTQGVITKAQYDERAAMYEDVLNVVRDNAEKKKEAIQSKMQEAYDTVFKQAIQTPYANTESYWKTVLIPLMEEAQKAGYTFPEEFMEFYRKGFNEYLQDYGTSPDSLARQLIEQGITDPKAIAEAVKNSVNKSFGGQFDDTFWTIMGGMTGLINNAAGNNEGLTDVELNAKNLLNISGWDLLSAEWKQYYVDTFVKAFGKDTTTEILRELGVEETDIKLFLGINPEIDTEDFRDKVKEQINNAIGDKILTKQERQEIMDSFGIDEALVSEIMREMGYYIGPKGVIKEINPQEPGTSGRFNPNRMIAAGAFSDSGNGRPSYVTTTPAAEAQEAENMANAVETGTRRANSTQDDLIRQLVNIARQIANKDFTVQVTPNSAWGGFNAKSGRARSRVTGDIPMEY